MNDFLLYINGYNKGAEQFEKDLEIFKRNNQGIDVEEELIKVAERSDKSKLVIAFLTSKLYSYTNKNGK